MDKSEYRVWVEYENGNYEEFYFESKEEAFMFYDSIDETSAMEAKITFQDGSSTWLEI